MTTHSEEDDMKYIKEFNKSDGGQIVLKDRTDIPVSSRKKTVVMRALSHFA